MEVSYEEAEDSYYIFEGAHLRGTADTKGHAALFAAAPELLAALKESLDVMGEWSDEGDPAWASRARSAIAKAEGRGEQ